MIRFSVQDWRAWAPGLEDRNAWTKWANGDGEIRPEGRPGLAAVPAMIRRRAGPLARIALEVSLSCTQEPMPVVFCSRHGEIHRSVDMLTALARDEPLSPASFGLSVHNAIGGLYSIIRGSHEQISAVAAGPGSAGFGLLEACAVLAGGAQAVLLVVYDQPLPDVFREFSDEIEHSFGWAWVVTGPSTDGQPHFSLACEKTTAIPPQVKLVEALGLRLMRAFLSGVRNDTLHSGDFSWYWQRHG